MQQVTGLLAAAPTPGDLAAARTQMAFSLGWHIIIACFGVGMPGLTVFMEWRGMRTGDVAYESLARTWARAIGVLFAVGAVSGTILSFEMGLLWPGLMLRFGDVIGLPFTLEGFVLHRSDLSRCLLVRLGPVTGTRTCAHRPAGHPRRRGVGVFRGDGQCVDESAARDRPHWR
jgi:hypothetical protein